MNNKKVIAGLSKALEILDPGIFGPAVAPVIFCER
jgi:hypothetical protein